MMCHASAEPIRLWPPWQLLQKWCQRSDLPLEAIGSPDAESVREACRVGRAAEKLQAAAREMAHVATVVEATSQPMARRDPLRAHMDIIYKEVVPLA